MQLLNTAATAAIINLLTATTDDISTKRALSRLTEYLTTKGSVSFDVNETTLVIESAHDDRHYQTTLDECDCPCGQARRKAQIYVNRVGQAAAGTVRINMCWHMQLAAVVAAAYRMSDLLGGLGQVVDESEPEVLELPVPSVAQMKVARLAKIDSAVDALY